MHRASEGLTAKDAVFDSRLGSHGLCRLLPGTRSVILLPREGATGQADCNKPDADCSLHHPSIKVHPGNHTYCPARDSTTTAITRIVTPAICTRMGVFPAFFHSPVRPPITLAMITMSDMKNGHPSTAPSSPSLLLATPYMIVLTNQNS